MATSVKEIIRAALAEIGIAAAGEPLSAEDEQDALSALNRLLAAWSVERLAVPVVARRSFPLTPGKVSYSIGQWDGVNPVAADIDSPRPKRILSAFVRDGGSDYPVEIIARGQYERITLKTTGGRPEYLFYDPAFPLGTITLYPAPEQAYALHVSAWEPIARIGNAADDLMLPDEYAMALEFNLAVAVARKFGRAVEADTAAQALAYKRSLKRLNAQPVEPARFEWSGRPAFDINGGD